MRASLWCKFGEHLPGVLTPRHGACSNSWFRACHARPDAQQSRGVLRACLTTTKLKVYYFSEDLASDSCTFSDFIWNTLFER